MQSFVFVAFTVLELLTTFQVTAGPLTKFWECRSQKGFGCLEEWHNSEFPGEYPWQSPITEKVRVSCSPGPPFIEGPAHAKATFLSLRLIGLTLHSLLSLTQYFDLKKILILNWFEEVHKWYIRHCFLVC